MSGRTDADLILEQVIASHEITAEQVQQLQALVEADWVVDHEETELLFRVNQALGKAADLCPEWTEFFVSVVTRMVVLDMVSPGEIDEQEGDWLGGLLEQYTVGNASEQRLCEEIEKLSSKIAGKAANRLTPRSGD